jgi:hypothetical protein
VNDTTGTVFGGFAATEWKVGPRYYGDGQSYLFTFHPEFTTYRWKEDNNNFFMLANEDSIAMGGGGNFGLYLDCDLFGGTSGLCETYDSPCLAGEENFQCANLEVWGFVPSSFGIIPKGGVGQNAQ